MAINKAQGQSLSNATVETSTNGHALFVSNPCIQYSNIFIICYETKKTVKHTVECLLNNYSSRTEVNLQHNCKRRHNSLMMINHSYREYNQRISIILSKTSPTPYPDLSKSITG
ncbi:unnamed protein product [Cylicocyclus nassatus]|uniref:Uncharacterized protein n=1 Tax=Cylicocyclus nassatus TaxID=53992 RepID=A0AA36M781_CYLNA|nr:unnamed protein product [Cylicocyclus nassatus]